VRINIVCPQCSAAAGGFAVFYVDTIREDGIYTGRCPKNHDVVVATQTLRHEMLFEIALNAIVDRYYREAVSSFAASVERYFEFAIRVIARQKDIQPPVFDKAWRIVSQQSERQLGAYVFLYLATFGEVPRTFNPEKEARFRNSVIHQGMLPSKTETLKFGEASYEIIQTGIHKLRDACIDDVNKELVEQMTKKVEKLGPRFPRSTQVSPTALNIIEDISKGYRPFSQILMERRIDPDLHRDLP
jgi:hypothetical protein